MAAVTVRLFDAGAGVDRAALLINGDRVGTAPLTVTSLEVVRPGVARVLLKPIGSDTIAAENFEADGLTWKRGAPAPTKLQFSVPDGTTDLFNNRYDLAAGVTVELRLDPGPGDSAFAALTVTGRPKIAGTDLDPIFPPVGIAYRYSWAEPPTAFPSTEPPSLEVLPPGDLPWPQLIIPGDSKLEFPRIPDKYTIPAKRVPLGSLPLSWGWDAIVIQPDPTNVAIALEVKRLRVQGVTEAFLSLLFVFKAGAPEVTIPANSDGLNLGDIQFRILGDGCFGIDATSSDLRQLPRLLTGEMPEVTGTAQKFQLRINAAGGSLNEVRLDWLPIFAAPLALPLPGFDFLLPTPRSLSLVAKPGADDPEEGRLVLAANFAEGTLTTITTKFGWPLGNDQQEKLSDGAGKPNDRIGISFKFSRDLSLAFFDIPLKGGGPKFLQALDRPLVPLDILNPALAEITDDDIVRGPEEPDPETSLATRQLNADDVTNLDLILPPNLQFPFLNGQPVGVPQVLELLGIAPPDPPAAPPVPVLAPMLASSKALVLSRVLKLRLTLGGLSLDTRMPVSFDLNRLAFDIQTPKGVTLTVPGGKPLEGMQWGLKFKFQPNDKNEAFILVLDQRNYAIKQAPGSRFTIEHSDLTVPGEAIVFEVKDFAIGPKGLSLSARITDTPAKLNGLETHFRFTEGTLQITENRIAGFTIAGSGPLPPDLVGDALADIALQFGTEDGKLKLMRGSAKVRGSKLLSCKASRFEFELDGLGLEFLREGGADHLFFTLSGKARYVLAAGDDTSGPLAWLPGLEIQLVDCPLTGNAAVIGKHVNFLITLAKKLEFKVLGCFTMQLRAIGFTPQFDKFDGSPAAMRLSGQIMLGDTGDVIETKVDLHDLYVALPEKGKFLPRLYLKRLGIRIAQGDTFALEAVVDFFNGEEIEPGIKAFGFTGEGSVTIKGLPAIAANMAWLRVSRDGIDWKRAWFIYLEARQLSLHIPVVEIYIREIGIGFGYRYTLAAFKAADETADVRKLLKKLKEISRTQGNLSKRDAWRVDLEEAGEDARWTVALRALFSSTSAQASPLNGYDPESESVLSSLYILDAVLAVRSDFTFFLAGRAWINTNYHDFHNTPGVSDGPLLTGFMMLSPKQSRFLANLSSNPNAVYGDHPPLPDFVKKLLKDSNFTATLLIEPGLIHSELGWPNQLRAKLDLGPLQVEVRAGQITRLSTRELVLGQSFLARGHLELKADFDAGFFGAGLSALADVAYGLRYIGVLAFDDPVNNSAFYGAIGLDIRVKLEINFWLRLKIGFIKISIDLSLSIDIQFTAALQVGVSFPEVAGALGTATVSIRIMGRQLGFNVRVGINDGAVEAARRKTERFLKMGLEAENVEAVPGTDAPVQAAAGGPQTVMSLTAPAPLLAPAPAPLAALPPGTFRIPDYFAGVAPSANEPDTFYVVLIPRSAGPEELDGFLPVPPKQSPPLPLPQIPLPEKDFEWMLPGPVPAGITLLRWVPGTAGTPGKFDPVTTAVVPWTMPWASEIKTENENGTAAKPLSLQRYLRYAFISKPDETIPENNRDFGDVIPTADPTTYWATNDEIEDSRIANPTPAAYDAAVRGAAEEFASPYFKFDPNSPYDSNLKKAGQVDTSVYTADGTIPKPPKETRNVPVAGQAEHELRSSILQAVTRDFFAYAAEPGKRAKLNTDSLAFQFGLIFRLVGSRTDCIEWLESNVKLSTLRQRNTTEAALADPAGPNVALFNHVNNWFTTRSPEFARVRKFEHANTVALAWKLEFPNPPGTLINNDDRDDPEHHLQHYVVRREHLDGNDPPLTVTVKAADVIHRETDAGKTTVMRLPPRFQFVDHFADQNAADVAALTAEGKLYVYTITPVDLAGNRSPRPLTVVAQRFPAEPPLVPTDAELVVDYDVPANLHDVLVLQNDLLPLKPTVRKPRSVTLRFSEPVDPVNRAVIPVATYRIVFRRDTLLPAGFYGADEAIRSTGAKQSVLTNARPLRTDIVVEVLHKDVVDDPSGDRADSGRKYVNLTNLVELLQKKNVFPADGSRWIAEGWTVFLQTESPGTQSRPGVRSVLAAASVRMTFSGLKDAAESRRFTRLEWLPNPVRLDLLPPIDAAGEVGFAKIPMPNLDLPIVWKLQPPEANATTLQGLQFEQHPARQRAVKIVWNQGPSEVPDHPIDLHARYQVYEFDAFARPGNGLESTGPIDFPDWSEKAGLKAVQEVDLLPANDLSLVPNTLRAPQMWEVWHPAAARRLRLKRSQQRDGTWPANRDTLYGPWYSARDSYLKWPDPLQGPAYLEGIVAILGATPAGQGFPTQDVEFGPKPARGSDQARANAPDSNPIPGTQPGVLAKLLAGTAADVDPYGWEILQRMGLAGGIRVRTRANGEYLHGLELFNAIRDAIKVQKNVKVYRCVATKPDSGVGIHFQPGGANRFYRFAVTARGPAFGLFAAMSDTPTVKTASGVSFLTLWNATDADVDVAASLNLKSLSDITPAAIDWSPFLHLEHLVQPGARLRIDSKEDSNAGGVPPSAALAMVQLSLRPAVQQHLRYQRIVFTQPDPAGFFRLRLRAADDFTMYRIDTGTPTAAEPLANGKDVSVTLAANPEGTVRLLVRGIKLEQFQAMQVHAQPLPETPPQNATFFQPIDWDAATFDSAKPNLFNAGEWSTLVTLLQAVEPGIAADDLNFNADAGKALVPDLIRWTDRFYGTGGDIANFDTLTGADLAATDKGPWIAAGYPRAMAPLPLAADAANRLTYYRPIESLWGQAYRYLLRPRGRYELLWEELGRSRALLGVQSENRIQTAQKRLGKPADGGVDVILPRIRPLAAPLVLSSRRLDRPAPPGAVRAPGVAWEVLVAEHHEQDAIDRNQTLLHRLEYRQTAQAMLRTFDPEATKLGELIAVFGRAISRRHHKDEPNLVPPTVAKLFLFVGPGDAVVVNIADKSRLDQVAAAINAVTATTDIAASVKILGTANERVLILESPTVPNPFLSLHVIDDRKSPSLVSACLDVRPPKLTWPVSSAEDNAELPTVPAVPDHLDFGALSPVEALSLDLPMRNAEFSRGVLAIQYDGLPFYYRHRLLLLAQSAAVTSAITMIEQGDFEYATAPCPARMDSNGGDLPARIIRITLARLWDSLPPSAQEMWPMEDPARPVPEGQRRPGALLDPATIYTVVLERPGSGNVQVVAEYFFNPNEPCGFESRKLSADVENPFRGVAVRVHPGGPTERPVLETLLLPASGAVDPSLVTVVPVSSRAAFATATDLPQWPATAALVPRECTLRRDVPLTPAIIADIEALITKVDVGFGTALRSLLSDTPTATATTCIGLEQINELGTPSLVVFDTTSTVKKLTWNGPVTQAQIDVLTEWAQTSLFGGTLTALLGAISPGVGTNVTKTIPIAEPFWKPRPTRATLPPSLQDLLLIGNGVIGFRGMMSEETGRRLLTIIDLTAAEKESVRTLYARTLTTGIDGRLRLVARRGGALSTGGPPPKPPEGSPPLPDDGIIQAILTL